MQSFNPVSVKIRPPGSRSGLSAEQMLSESCACVVLEVSVHEGSYVTNLRLDEKATIGCKDVVTLWGIEKA